MNFSEPVNHQTKNHRRIKTSPLGRVKTSELGLARVLQTILLATSSNFQKEVMWILLLSHFLQLEVMLGLGVDAK